MTEEPYRWVEAISNRREYVEHELVTGSPIAALSYRDGILFLTLSRERQKIFEIYDRIALGAIGHPGDIERLRLAALEVASTEGFTRSTQDVSLRRLASYSLSPMLKTAFEQIYGPPFLARLLFAELGRKNEQNLFVRLDYDGTMHTNGGSHLRVFEEFGVLSGTAASTRAMEKFLATQKSATVDLAAAVKIALDAWCVGHLSLSEEPREELPTDEQITAHREAQLAEFSIEAAVLDRTSPRAVTYRALTNEDWEP